MPYKKTQTRKSYKSRFNDKKINTAIERKIQEIAVREDKKSYRRDSRITQDAGNYLNDGTFDPNNVGLGLRTIPVTYNIAWSAADAIPTQETAAIQFPNTVVTRLQTNPGIRQTDEIFIDKISIRGAIRYAPTTLSEQGLNIRIAIASVEVPVPNKPGNTLYSEVEYEKLINPAIVMPGYMNGYFWPPDFYRAISSQKIVAVKQFKIENGRYNGCKVKQTFSFTHKFKKPFRQRYDIKDPNGILPTDRILYYAIAIDQEMNAAGQRPNLTCNHKVYYHEKS